MTQVHEPASCGARPGFNQTQAAHIPASLTLLSRSSLADSFSRARDNRIRDKDNGTERRLRPLYDCIDAPYLLEELLARYQVDFTRTPVNERCVFCKARYLGETRVRLIVGMYAVSNQIWIVHFLRANNVDFSEPVEGLLMVWSKKWRNAGEDPRTAFSGLNAINADGGRNIVSIENDLEARL